MLNVPDCVLASILYALAVEGTVVHTNAGSPSCALVREEMVFEANTSKSSANVTGIACISLRVCAVFKTVHTRSVPQRSKGMN
jgi:hypothetical protein